MKIFVTILRRDARAVIACLALVGADFAAADAPSEQPNDQLAEIVVTAQKRTENLEKSASSISVISGADLTERGASSFADYISSVPSVSLTSQSPGNQIFSIRGVSDTSTTGQITQKTVGIYLDDIVVSNNYTSPDLHTFDLSRVEVLRGPQGTLYGDGSIGGVIRLITNKADPTKFAAEADTEISGTHNGGLNYTVNGMLNLPLKEGVWGLRLVGYDVRNDGFINDSITGQKRLNSEDTKGGRVSLAFTPDSDLSVTLNLLSQDMKLGGQNFVLVNPPIGDLQIDNATAEAIDYRYSHVNLTVNDTLPFADFTSSTTVSSFKRIQTLDLTDFVESVLGIRLVGPGDQGDDTKSYAEEMRLTSTTPGPIDWLLGAYFFNLHDDNYEVDTSRGLDTLLPSFGVSQGSPQYLGNDLIYTGYVTNKLTQYALFGDGTYHLTPKLSATIGVRWSLNELSQSATQAGFAFGGPPYTYNLSTSGSKWTTRWRLAYQATQDFLIYAQAAQGYRIGGLNPATPSSIKDPNFPQTYQNDSLWSYELGTKTVWLDNRLTLNAALFYTKWTDVQVQQDTPDGFQFVGNGGAAHTQGIEFELASRPLRGLTASVGVSALQAEIDRDVPALNAVRGDPLPGVAKVTASAAVEYEHPLTGALSGYVRGDSHYVSTVHENFGEPDDDSGDYTLTNARFGLRTTAWDVALFVNNIADARANLYTSLLTNSSAGFYNKQIAIARPRTIGVSARYLW